MSPYCLNLRVSLYYLHQIINYLHQWNEVNTGGDYEIGRSVRRCVCPSVCLCTPIGGDMHSHERLLVV